MPSKRPQLCDLCQSEILEDPAPYWSFSTASVGHCGCQSWRRTARSAPWVSETEEYEADDIHDRTRDVPVREPFDAFFPDQKEAYVTAYVKVVSEKLGAKGSAYPSPATTEFVLAVCRRTSDWWPTRRGRIRDDQVAGLLLPTRPGESELPDAVLEDLVPGYRQGRKMPRSAARRRLHKRAKKMLVGLDDVARSAA